MEIVIAVYVLLLGLTILHASRRALPGRVRVGYVLYAVLIPVVGMVEYWSGAFFPGRREILGNRRRKSPGS